jgi:hypothetical protein
VNYWYLSVIIGGLELGFFFWRKKSKPEVSITGIIRRTKNESLNDYLEIKKEDVIPRSYDLLWYIKSKSNQNLEVIGQARGGKTSLAEYLCMKLPEKKIVISFKKFLPTKRDFEGVGCQWIDVTKYVPALFDDPRAFVEAVRTAFFADLSSKGLMIDQIVSKVNSIMMNYRPKSFEEFYKRLDDERRHGNFEESIANIVKDKIGLLERATEGAEHGSIDFNSGNIVLDLGNLPDEESRTFLAEYYCRMIYKIEMQQQNTEHVRIVIDEAWHLLTNAGQKSIIGTMLLQGAYAINLMIITQNFTHLDEAYRGHFGAVFSFKNNNDKDLQSIKSAYTDGLIWEGIGALDSFEFIDLGFPHKKKDVVVWKISKQFLETEKARARDMTGFEILSDAKKEVVDVVTPAVEEIAEKKISKEEIEKGICEVLEKSEFCMYYSELSTSLGFERNSVERVAMINILKRLVKDKKILEKNYITSTLKAGQKPRRYYFAIPKGESQLHRTILRDAVNVLTKMKVVFEEGKLNQGYDLYLPNCYIEAESGLKHSLKEYDEKIMLADKTVLTVVCNESDRERYSYLQSVGLGKTRIVLLNELADTVKEFQKNEK